MSNSNSVRWAIVSTGRIAEDFTKALKLNGSTIAAVSSRSEEKAREFADEHGIAASYGSLDEMLKHAKADFDVCYIGTPHAKHEDDVIKCLRAGAHVLAEKPLAVNAKQVQRMIDVAREENLFLMEGMWTRFFPVLAELRRLLHAERVIGELCSMHATFGFYPEADTSSRLYELDDAGGALLDIGVYLLSAVSLGIGGFDKKTCESLKATAQFGETGCDTLTSLALTMQNGVTAFLTCSVLAELPNEALYVGTKGRIVVCDPLNSPTKLTVFVNNEKKAGETESRIIEIPIEGARDNDEKQFNWKYSRGFIYEIRAVEKAISAGKTGCDEVPLSETLAIATLMDQARQQIGLQYPFEK